MAQPSIGPPGKKLIGSTVKRKAWRRFTTTLSTRDQTSRVWNTLKAIDGRTRRPLPDTPLTTGGSIVIGDDNKANAAMAHYARTSRLLLPRSKIKAASRAVNHHLASANSNSIQCEAFSATELAAALHKSGGKSAGADGIHPDLLRHLPPAGLDVLLTLLNRSRIHGKIPTQWKSHSNFCAETRQGGQ